MQVSSNNNGAMAAIADADGDGKGKLETNTGRDWMIDNYFVAQSMGYSGLEFTHTQPAPTASKRERGGREGGRAQVRFPEDQKLSCIIIDTQRATQPAQLSATSQQQRGPMPDQTRPDQTRLYAVSESRPG